MDIEFPGILKPLDDPYRYKITYGGRGSGKSWSIAMKLIIRAIESKVRILCTRQLQNSITESVHKLLSDQINRMGLHTLFTITRDRIVSVNGSEFIFKGIAHNTNEIKSLEGIDICWIEEGESLTTASWNIIDPTIRKEGSEIWVSFNTRFKQDFLYKHFIINTPPPSSLVIKVNYNDNPFFPEVLRRQMEHMKETDYDLYLHIWCGELKLIADGAIFGKQVIQMRKGGRLLPIPIVDSPIDTFWDIGKNDQTAIWFLQQVGQEYRLVDYYEARLEEIEHYTDFIKSLDYIYGTHYLPHDAGHDRLGQHGRTIEEQVGDNGVKPTEIVPRIQHKATAIGLARELFPKCYFHKGEDERGMRVDKGLEHLATYKYKFKDADDVYQMTPHHDAHSNGADAFQQMAQANYYDPNDFIVYQF